MVNSTSNDVVGLVLAGGASARMGSDKALVSVSGRPMLDWVAETLHRVAPHVLVAGEPRLELDLDAEFIPDDGDAHRGPLAGLSAAMRHVDPTTLLVTVAVDQPWVAATTLRAMLSRYSALPVIPVPDGVRQTTCGIYPAHLSMQAIRELNSGGSIQSLLDRTSFDPFTESDSENCGEDGRSWFSADSPDRLEDGLKLFGAPSQR